MRIDGWVIGVDGERGIGSGAEGTDGGGVMRMMRIGSRGIDRGVKGTVGEGAMIDGVVN